MRPVTSLKRSIKDRWLDEKEEEERIKKSRLNPKLSLSPFHVKNHTPLPQKKK